MNLAKFEPLVKPLSSHVTTLGFTNFLPAKNVHVRGNSVDLADEEVVSVPQSANLGSTKSWAGVIKGKNRNYKVLKGKFIEADRVGSKKRLQPGTIKKNVKKVSFTLVFYFHGKNMAYGSISAKAKEMWAKFGLVDVRAFGEGFFFFGFATKRVWKNLSNTSNERCIATMYILRSGPLIYDNKEVYKCVQVWVKISVIPSYSWNYKYINDVASEIGVPILFDEVTSFSPYAFFAKVLDEKLVNSEFPLQAEMFTEKNAPFMVNFEYNWWPDKCAHYKGFGHTTFMCPKYKGKKKANNKFTRESSRFNKHNENHATTKKNRNKQWVVKEKVTNLSKKKKVTIVFRKKLNLNMN